MKSTVSGDTLKVSHRPVDRLHGAAHGVADGAACHRLRGSRRRRPSASGFSVANITAIVIGRSRLDPSSRGSVTVEIRAEETPFQRSGRVNWEIDEREIKAYLPRS
jgi:hypothetical protein